MTLIELIFDEMMVTEGFKAWYETEDRWDDWGQIMLDAGCDADEVEEFFSEMAWDL